MKHLTINQIARANLRHNRRAYLSMAVGIFMAVFLAATLCLSVQGIVAHRAEDRAAIYGRMDMFTINNNNMTDEELLETGLFKADIGHVYVTAEVPDIAVAIGFYDETAVPLMNRILLEGRMPEVPGEIALEQSALDRLRMERAVGDTLTLTVTPIEGLPEERTYTIVGLLSEQSSHLGISAYYSFGQGTGLWPAILTCAEEPGFSSGNVTIHRLLTLRPMVSKLQALTPFQYDGVYERQRLYSVNEYGEVWDDISFFHPVISFINNTILMLTCLLGGALMIAVCSAISGAMESQLARKTEAIGMLRAVGATKRQIRRIFGRESWIIALMAAPAAILLACAFVWGLSQAAPTYMLFRPSLWVLLPVLLLVTVTILVASSLPLRRASRIMPMSVLRDTAILRRAQRIRSRKRFKVPALVARRQLTLHPTRLIGSVVLVAAMLVMSGFGAITMATDVTVSFADKPTFRLGNGSYFIVYGASSFGNYISPETLNEADLNQLSTLPMVSKVLTSRNLRVSFELDTVGEYFTSYLALGGAQALGASRTYRDEQRKALEEEYNQNYSFRTSMLSDLEREQMNLRAAQAVLGTDKPIVNMQLEVLPMDLKELEPYILEGKLDIDAINAGREVIVYAPTYHLVRMNDGGLNVGPGYGSTAIASVANDSLFVGQTLPIAQFYMTDEDAFLQGRSTQEDFDDFYQSSGLCRATVTIGALLDQIVPNSSLYEACIITTEQGLRAMGLKTTNPASVDIYLSGVPDKATENWLVERINSIASRGGVSVTNLLEQNRQWETARMQITVVFACITLVFFAAAAGLISGNISRQIRADSRMIGTLRAVGADDRALIGCYSGSIFISIGLGTAVACLIIGLLIAAGVFGNIAETNYLIAMLSCAALAALIVGCCLWVLRQRVKDVIKKSIVENIKEL
ncbi:MAG: FtsX-like permease family protein [Christensenellaceae bacterium]|nr:FtsX-like permease family protein [Christensenellaceae bacterium]